MSDILQAARWLNEGKKVGRRQHIAEGSYFVGTDEDDEPISFHDGGMEEGDNAHEAVLWPGDLLAKDWEISPEKKERG